MSAMTLSKEHSLCATCQYWQPKPHDGWEEPSYGGGYDVYDLRRHLADRNRTLSHWPGDCQLCPEWRPVTALHGCGSHVTARYFDMPWQLFAEIWELRGRIEEQRQEIKRLTASLKELRAKRRDEQRKRVVAV